MSALVSRLGTYAVIAAIVCISFWSWGSFNRFAGNREGRAIERAAWEDATRKLRDQMDAERRAAQAQIDSVERSYLAAQQREALLVADLETAIAAMEAENAETDTAGCACRPALPRGLILQLDAIGR